MIEAVRVSVGTTATEIVSPDFDGGDFSIRNRDGDSVFIGGDDDVTTGTGYEVGAGEAIGLKLNQGDVLYGIVASGTARVDVLRVG